MFQVERFGPKETEALLRRLEKAIGVKLLVALRQRLREISADLITLIFGAACLLVWAGLVEAFLSQYHEPIIPYAMKISFGLVELILLFLFLARSGAVSEPPGDRKGIASVASRSPRS